MACSALVEYGLWSETAIERQMSHKERNNVRAAYTHKAEFLEERRMIMTWWSRFLEANREAHVTLHAYAVLKRLTERWAFLFPAHAPEPRPTRPM